MNQKKDKMNRREAFKAVGMVPLLVSLSRHPLVPAQEGEWTPFFLKPEQNETVSIISELIIPQTDTPGARAAKVNEYIDFSLSQETSQVQEAFIEGLNWIDQRSQQLHGESFVQLPAEEQRAILETISSEIRLSVQDRIGGVFFQDIKDRTVEGYYTSEIGLGQELGYQGKTYVSEFPGCRHEEHINWEPD